MVSLNTQPGRRSGGGMSFDDRSFTAADEPAHENTPLIDTTEQPYRPIRTTGFIVLHIFLTLVFMASIVVIPWQSGDLTYDCANEKGLQANDTGYQIALYIHASAYIVSLGFDRVYHHYQDLSRRDGYLEFYRQTKHLRRLPLFVISLGNAILVALIEVFEYLIDRRAAKFCHPVWFLVALSAVEVIVLLIVLSLRTIRFNKEHARPDATQEDWLATFMPSDTTPNEIGFRDETYKENVLEKQGDLIRYLRERNEHLSRLVLQYKQEADFQQGIPNNHL